MLEKCFIFKDNTWTKEILGKQVLKQTKQIKYFPFCVCVFGLKDKIRLEILNVKNVFCHKKCLSFIKNESKRQQYIFWRKHSKTVKENNNGNRNSKNKECWLKKKKENNETIQICCILGIFTSYFFLFNFIIFFFI